MSGLLYTMGTKQNQIHLYLKKMKKLKNIYIKCDCIAGNGQRYYALTKIKNPDTLL